MFKALLEWAVAVLLILLLITQILIPLFIPELELFWIFKHKSKEALDVKDPAKTDLDIILKNLGSDAVQKAKELDTTMHKVDDSINTLKEIKDKVQH